MGDMAQTAAERLAEFQTLYDAAMAQLEGGPQVYRYRIGNREVYKPEFEKHVKFLEERIEYWQAKVNATTRGRARNLIKKVRRG